MGRDVPSPGWVRDVNGTPPQWKAGVPPVLADGLPACRFMGDRRDALSALTGWKPVLQPLQQIPGNPGDWSRLFPKIVVHIALRGGAIWCKA